MTATVMTVGVLAKMTAWRRGWPTMKGGEGGVEGGQHHQ